jgi:hypothetical protein
MRDRLENITGDLQAARRFGIDRSGRLRQAVHPGRGGSHRSTPLTAAGGVSIAVEGGPPWCS